MKAHTFFCGVVTHPKSTYSTKDFEESFSQLSGPTIEGGLDFRFKILSENHFGENEITSLGILVSSIYLKIIECRWSRYLKNGSNSLLGEIFQILKFLLLAFPRMVNPALRREERIKALRILNINWSHYRLLELGNSFDSSGLLILEDDALIPGKQGFIDLVTTLHQISLGIPNPLHFFDLSESYSLSDLGAAHLVDEFFSITLDVNQKEHLLQHMEKAITNTVCSVFYSSAMAETLEVMLKRSLSRKFERYIPVDWLINLYLMRLKKESIDVLCFKSEPGIFRQQSFLPKVRNLI